MVSGGLMRVPVVSGIYTDLGPDFRAAYPVNMVPVPMAQGISDGYLRAADGVVAQGSGPGACRGGIAWNGILYRVMGTKFVAVNSTGGVTEIGTIGGTGQVTMTYGFDYLAIVSAGDMWLYDGSALAQVTDPDLGTVLDVVWVDGYFVTTDGEFLVVTELNDPFAVDPLKYGSSEADPDPIVALLKLRNEVYALNRYTIEVFQNVGGTGFPFQRVTGAQVQKGVVGTHACCVFMENIAFIGSGQNEAPSVYLGANGTTAKIATREIDIILSGYDLSEVVMDARVDRGAQHLHIRLPDKTLVFDAEASRAFGQSIWFIYSTSVDGNGPWDAVNPVWCYDRWNVGRVERPELGYLSTEVSSHWGELVGWQFQTPIMFNETRGAIVYQLELIGLPGRAAFGANPVISTEYSHDGVTWSQPKTISAGTSGQRTKRLVWFRQGMFKNMRFQRFRGTSDAQLSVAALEATVEGLA